MKKMAIFIAFSMNSLVAHAQVCGRFTDPVKSIFKQSTDIQLDFKKVSPLSDMETSQCFYYDPRGIRCDITYDGKRYYFFFNKEFSKVDLEHGAVEAYFMQWLRINDGKKAIINTYNTLFEWENDYEEIGCPNWYEQLTYTLTIDDKESVIIE